MAIKFSGSVHFANGEPAPNVEVRLFDKDSEGKQDDDLTITPGRSDNQGNFSLTYEPLRYLDFHTLHLSGTAGSPGAHPEESVVLHIPDVLDVYLPYLKFNYTFNGLNCQHSSSLRLFKTSFYLPEKPPVSFLPSIQGFHFKNSFSGYFLPFSTPAFMGSRKVSSDYGLCGGMCAAAYDFALAAKPIPGLTSPPNQGTRLHRYLYRRQIDSFGSLGQQLVKVIQWTTLPDDTMLGTWRRSADECSQIRLTLENQNPVVLALIYEHASSLVELSKVIFNNHQVLAYAYHPEGDGRSVINIYDPNLPGRDDVTIATEEIVLAELSTNAGAQPVMGLKTTQMLANTPYKKIRGFFTMPYSPVIPPERL
jgi:hypothetical protein